jgi:aldehyde dehydrogenase
MIMQYATENIIPVTLELGGKSPNVFLPDVMAADDEFLDKAVEGFVMFAFNQGEVCTCPSRALIHESIYDEFMDRLVSKARSLVVGDATDFATQVGPVVNESQYKSILDAIEQAKADGATLACGGGRAEGAPDKGYYVAPTVFTDVDNAGRTAQEEIFGPVLAVQRWKDEMDVIRRANNSIYGLAGGVWSRDTRRAIEIAKALRTGTVWINDWHLINSLAPFGGYKQSGIGRELGTYGLREYTEVKHIHVDQGVPRSERYFYDVLLG